MQVHNVLQKILRVGATTAFILVVMLPSHKINAQNSKLDGNYNNTHDLIEFLDKNNTAQSLNDTQKIIKLGFNDDEQELFNKETYRKKQRVEKKSLTDKAKKTAAINVDDNDKQALSINKGDYSLTFGGAIKIENYFQRNMVMLNRNLPDEAEYFKDTFDFTTSFAYGEKRFGHKAIEGFIDFTHKGVWGKNGTFADAAPGEATQLTLASTTFGNHSHSNSRPLIWIRDGWLNFSLNAIVDSESKNLHFIKIGWFPFVLGRAIALGYVNGLNRATVGLYENNEDKSPAGINITGEIIKDVLSYDLYFSRLEERNKDLRDTTGMVRSMNTPTPVFPWRGLGKNNDLIAARLKAKPFNNQTAGKLELEPYVMYNTAPDQRIDLLNDSDTNLGTYGLAFEHTYNNFEWGGEVAGNFGSTKIFAIDKNTTTIANVGGMLAEQYTKIVDANNQKQIADPRNANNPLTQALSTGGQLSYQAYKNNNFTNTIANINGVNITSASDRFTPATKHTLAGWMGVLDGAYNFKEQNLKIAFGGGYASGDSTLDDRETNSTYKGFIGLHEIYSGKRVKSIMLDEARLQRPVISKDSGVAGSPAQVDDYFSFSNLVFGCAGSTWSPKLYGKKCDINPNVITFWSAYQDQKPILQPDGSMITDQNIKVSSYLGTEVNLLTQIELLKDFTMFAKFMIFVPGQFFNDFTGVKVGARDYVFVGNDDDGTPDITNYRIAADPAFHVNVGFSYKF